MNTANKLTILRVFMIPVFLLVLYLDVPGANYWALGIFVIASLTDTLDGYIARHYNQTTDFGKFMDPLADKCLVTAAMLWFVEIGQMPAWALLVVIIREFAVSGLRMVAADQGAGDCRRLVGKGQDGLHHGVHRTDVPAHLRVDQRHLCGCDRIDHPLFRRGVFYEEPGRHFGDQVRGAPAGEMCRTGLTGEPRKLRLPFSVRG